MLLDLVADRVVQVPPINRRHHLQPARAGPDPGLPDNSFGAILALTQINRDAASDPGNARTIRVRIRARRLEPGLLRTPAFRAHPAVRGTWK